MSDANDTLREGGPDAVRAEFDKVVPFGVIKGVTFQGDVPIDPPRMLVKNLLPFEGIVFIAGQSGTGKTGLAVDLGMAVATGTPFLGRSIRERRGVFILAAEGGGTIGYRIEAARRARVSGDERVPIAFSSEIPQLSTDNDIAKFVAKLGLVGKRFEKEHGVPLGIVMIDTVSAAFQLENENDNSEAARTIAKMRELGRRCNALIMPIHHFGKSTVNGLRGGSAWRDGADVVLAVLTDPENKAKIVEINKARDGPDGPIASFVFRCLQLGVNEEGDPYGTQVVEPLLGRAGSITRRATKEKPEGRAVQLARAAFVEALDAQGENVRIGGDGPLVRGVRLAKVRLLFDRRYATAEDDPKKAAEAARVAFGRGLNKLASEFGTQKIDGVDWGWSLKG